MIGRGLVVGPAQQRVVLLEPALLVWRQRIALACAVLVKACALDDVVRLCGRYIVKPPAIRIALHEADDPRRDDPGFVIGAQPGEVRNDTGRFEEERPASVADGGEISANVTAIVIIPG